MTAGHAGRIAFVTPRYGDDVMGGAEAMIREGARGLAARGWEVDVLTTCARDHTTMINVYEPGTSADGEIVVRRFVVHNVADTTKIDALTRRIWTGEKLAWADQLTWLSRHRVPGLFHALVAEASRYDALLFAPYLSWTTAVCTRVDPARSIVIPCLHDESYARVAIVRDVLEQVRELWFQSEPEHELAHRLLSPPAHSNPGSGVWVPHQYDPDGFRARYGLTRPFVLFAGRREREKGWDALLAAFAHTVRRYDLPFDLLTTGSGRVDPPADIADRVIDLGFVSDRERDDAVAAAAASIQPSANESFSRLLMESWLAGTPVIATAAGAVVAWHCARSQAGLTYSDEYELGQCLRFVAEAPEAASELGRRGRAYVLEHYDWNVVLDRWEANLNAMVRAA